MAITHLQRITTKAKQLRKSNPKLKWIDAVKKASKLMPKKTASKKVGAVKKKAAKKTAVKKHVDTKSHNVNIRVVSGAKKPNYKKPSAATKLQHYSWLTGREQSLLGVIAQIKNEKPLTPAKRAEIVSYQKQLKAVRQQKAIEKKII